MDGIDTISNSAGLIFSRASVEEDQLRPRCKKRLTLLNSSHTTGPSPSSDWIWRLVDNMMTLR